MKKLLLLSLVFGAVGAFAACSQAEKHPALLADCTAGCISQPIPTGGTIVVADASTKDAAADGGDGGSFDGAIPDGGLPDAISLDAALE